MKILLLLNDPPYGTERTSIGAAAAGQKVPDGYYHLDRMLTGVLRCGGQVGCCGACLDARA